MEKVKIELFVSTTCPHCKNAEIEVKDAVRNFEQVDFEKIRINKKEGLKKAEKYRIIAVPALVINEKIWKGNIEKNAIKKHIEKLIGKRRSFFFNPFFKTFKSSK